MCFHQILGIIILLSALYFQREIVDQLLEEPDSSYSIICDNLKKVYHGQDGNAEKIAVTGLSLSMQRGQCFGILGPNGAGKTSLLSMVISMYNSRCIISFLYIMLNTAISLFKEI
jgi:ABC-type glutathione transport system ATPase component